MKRTVHLIDLLIPIAGILISIAAIYGGYGGNSETVITATLGLLVIAVLSWGILFYFKFIHRHSPIPPSDVDAAKSKSFH